MVPGGATTMSANEQHTMIDTVIEGTEEGGREITIEFFNLSKKEYARAWACASS
jgi:hypothetical protein